MRRLTRSVLVVSLFSSMWMTGCAATVDEQPPLGENAAAVTTTPDGAPICIGADGFHPPTFTLKDLSDLLGSVLYFSSPANVNKLFTGSRTNWYDEDTVLALAKLATMRGILEKFNLSDTYLPGGRPPPVDCTGKLAVRQADGTCNDPVDTRMGAAGVRFGRNIPVLLPNPASPIGYSPNPKVYPDAATMMSPSPREVSRKLLTRKKYQPVPFLNMLAAGWVQFMVHDWFNHSDGKVSDAFHIALGADDPLRAKYGLSELVVPKSVSAARAGAELALLPPVFENEVTHWWDGSQIYGSDLTTANSLRAKDKSGKLLATLTIDKKGLLPKATDGYEQTGMRKNFWVGIGLLHNLFAAEHNAVVAHLRTTHPEFDEQGLYDHARLIVAAEIAKIHTVEWTPAILPNPTLATGMSANWYGLKKFVAPGTDLSPLIGYVKTLPAETQSAIFAAVLGVVGGERNLHNAAFSMTEEFVSVYRMHPLLPDALKVQSAMKGMTIGIFKTEKLRNADGRKLEEKYGLTDLLYTFGVEHPGALVLQNYPKFLQELKLPFGVVDLGTIDVLRDRERGLPRYNDFREQLRLPRVPSIEVLTNGDVELSAKLHEVYGPGVDAIDKVDVMVGTFAEAQRPSCYGFGETLFQVFTLMATRRLQGDRFYTTDYRPEIYTSEGLAWVEAATMKSVLLRHHPELGKTGLAALENAFYPWGKEGEEDEHCDKDD